MLTLDFEASALWIPHFWQRNANKCLQRQENATVAILNGLRKSGRSPFKSQHSGLIL
jgi:hypothetical protein